MCMIHYKGCDNEILAMLIKNGAKIDDQVDLMLICSFRRRRRRY